MKRRVHIAKLGIALIAFANGTAALGASKLPWQDCAGRSATVEAAGGSPSRTRVQRLPRVPRREPFEPGLSETAAGCE